MNTRNQLGTMSESACAVCAYYRKFGGTGCSYHPSSEGTLFSGYEGQIATFDDFATPISRFHRFTIMNLEYPDFEAMDTFAELLRQRVRLTEIRLCPAISK